MHSVIKHIHRIAKMTVGGGSNLKVSGCPALNIISVKTEIIF